MIIMIVRQHGFELHDRLHKISKIVEETSKEFKICLMTASQINYKCLAEIHPEFWEECYVSKKKGYEIF
ncbi:MAG: hypothetical protein ACPKPY_10710 [Nitrososphaeraceae archaeon]